MTRKTSRRSSKQTSKQHSQHHTQSQKQQGDTNLAGSIKSIIQSIAQGSSNTSRSHSTIGLIAIMLGLYSLYLYWLGLRPIVMLSGLIIVTITILSWLTAPSPSPPATNNNLLDPAIFYSQLQTLFHLPKTITLEEGAQSHWQQTYTTSQSIHSATVAIAQQESLFIPDLLDTLHTVLELISQYVQAFHATQQMKTLIYQKVAQQQILTSHHRLTETQRQLQELHDQLLAEDIATRSPRITSGVSTRLQTLIDTNRTELTPH